MQKLPVSTFSAAQKDALLDQVKTIVDAGEITPRSDSTPIPIPKVRLINR